MPENVKFEETEKKDTYDIFNGEEQLGTLTVDREEPKKSKMLFEENFSGNRKNTKKRLIQWYFDYVMSPMSPMTA